MTVAPEAEFIPRYDAAKRLGKHPKTVAGNEAKWGLAPIRINGQVSYTAKSVDALVDAWTAEAKRGAVNHEVIVPAGWRLLIVNARGPFIGEDIPDADELFRCEGENPDLQSLPGAVRISRCMLSSDLLSVAFEKAIRYDLNVISNGRGIVATRHHDETTNALLRGTKADAITRP